MRRRGRSGGGGGGIACHCTTGGGSTGNTPASRSAFYEVNRIAEQARGIYALDHQLGKRKKG